MSSGFTFLLGYTYSKSIDDGSGLRTLGTDQIGAQNSYCIYASGACRSSTRSTA